jgi:membrane protease YdiL (CAAX protease family)
MDLPEPLLVLVAMGFTGLLVILRFDAERFGAAEYDEVDPHGNAPSFRRRVAWYAVGIAGVAAVAFLHPDPDGELFLGPGDRVAAITLGLAYGFIGSAIAVGFAYYRYRYFRFPDVFAYPGALVNSVATAFVDEAVFRGLLFGFLINTGLDANLANLIQALIYALATRLGAPGRPRWMLPYALGIGLAGGWLTGVTGGIGAAFLGHAVTRFAFFLTTGHAGQPRVRGAEDEEIEKRRRPPEGWRIINPRESRER